MKFRFLLLLSAVLFSFNVHAQAYITVCDPDRTVPVNLYAGTASCNATATYPFGYSGLNTLGGTYTQVIPEGTSSTVSLGTTSWVYWDQWVWKNICSYNYSTQRNECSYKYVRESQSGLASAYCTAAVPFSRVGSKVIKGQCRQEINPNDCGCVWQTTAFTGGQAGSQTFTVYRPAGSCSYDSRVIYSDGRTTCSGGAWPPVASSASSKASSSVASSVSNIPSGSSCTWPSSPNTGAATYPGRVEVYYVIGACTHRYKEVYFDGSGNYSHTRYQ